MSDTWMGAATLHEAMGRRGVLPTHLKPVHPAFRICGPAFPVLCREGSNLAVHQALYAATPGDVLIVQVEASRTDEFGYFGEIMAEAAKARGLGGVADATVDDDAPQSPGLRRLGHDLAEVAELVRAGGLDLHD